MSKEATKDQYHELATAEQQLREADHIPQWLKDVLMRGPRPPPVQYWSPPNDPDKPSLPYLPGFSTKIYRHYSERETSRPVISTDYLEKLTQSEAVVANPSNETTVFAENETAQLTITAPIAVGEARGAQVVSCTITLPEQNGGAARTFQAVAKFYDPLYYNFQSSIGNHPEDCAYDADQDYKAEAAAYEHLEKWGERLEGATTFAPEYYGSWIFWLPISINGKPQTRSVRLVLIEHLNGVSLQDLRVQNNPDKSMGTDAFHYPEEYRLEVLARVLDGYARQLRTGLSQGDLAGRNVVLVTNNPQGGTVCGLTIPRIVLIDYNRAKFDEVSLEQVAGLPCNPGARFWDLCLWDTFGGWVPNEWEDMEVQQQWLLERFEKSEQRRLYHPSSEFFLSRINSVGQPN